MKVVFLSSGAREKPLEYILKKGIQVAAVLVPILSSKNDRFKNVIMTAVRYGIPVYSVTKHTLKNILSELDFDILVSCGFSIILPKEIIEISKYAINVHPTLLPKYRGYRSGPYILINGEQETGVTIHFINEEMDKGDIIAQRSYKISRFDTLKSLNRKNSVIESELLFDVINQLSQNNFVQIAQEENEACTYSHMRKPEDSLINANERLIDLYNQIRVCDPIDYPAYFYIDNEKVGIKLWRLEKPEDEFDMI
jgi:methionyl-tRNA formyltransferase